MEMMINVRHGKTRMMRLLGFLLAVAFMMGAAFAESAAPAAGDSILAQLDGINWSFCSGAGGWSTDMQIAPDGSFSGDYHDSEIGEYADAYPDGTIYYCSFTGKLSLVEQVNENIWKLRVDELKLEEKPGTETLADNVRYVTSEIYGLSEGDEMLLYRPGTPLDGFTDDMKLWAHVFDDGDPNPAELKTWFISSEKNDSGFVGYVPETGTTLANPWEDVTVEQLRQNIGMYFNVPEEAEKAIYRWCAAEKLAEMQFAWNDGIFCFRSQPVALEKNQLTDISGMYYTWEHEEPAAIGGFAGSIAQAPGDNGSFVERCLWYDNAAGLMCSLSVIAPDLDGLDLTALAEQIWFPAQK